MTHLAIVGWAVSFCGWEESNEEWGIVLFHPENGEIFQPIPETDCRALEAEGVPFKGREE